MESRTDESLPIVVIGGGIAGVSCIEVLAEELPDEQLILISASSLIKVASNVRTTGRTIDEFDVSEQSNSYLETKFKNVKVINSKVIAMKAAKHELTLQNSNTIIYKKLCICSGGKPKLIKQQNHFEQFVLGIRDTETVQNFKNKLESAKRIVIVGNGGIATELVYQIQNCNIIWSVKDDSFGATFFDAVAAKFFSNNLNDDNNDSNSDESNVSKRWKYTVSDQCNQYKDSKEFGTALGPDWALGQQMKGSAHKTVQIEYNCEVNHIYGTTDSIPESKKSSIVNDCLGEDNVWSIYVELTNGRIYGCDFVVSATGVTPNTHLLLNGNNFKTGSDGGLLVNNEMLTSEEDVYAAGDVCTAGWQISDFWFQMRLWTQARLMGVYAAYCIASHLRNSSPLLYFNFEIFAHVTRFFGYKVVLLGLFNGQKLNNNYEILLRVSPQKEFVKVIMKNGKMCGAILIGDTDLEETFENLILNQIDLSSYGDDLLNSNIDIDDYFD